MASVVPSHLPMCTHRYIMFVSYLGSKYIGSQRQILRDETGVQDTVQEALEWSLGHILPKSKCRITACSRTDRGVHALMNCYTLPLMDFETPTEKVKRIANANLVRKLHDIVINEVLLAPAEFHPRRYATSREYIYRLAVFDNFKRSHETYRHSPSEIMHALPVAELYKALPLHRFDRERAMEAIDLLRGEHDFASFAFRPADGEDTVRHLEVNLSQVEPATVDQKMQYPYTIYNLRFKSRAFLYNQVRRMVGSIISYATYKSIKLTTIQKLLDNPSPKNWLGSIIIAEPYGLYLSRINFDRSAFKGAYKSYEDKTEEAAKSFLLPIDESDDQKHECEKVL